MIFRRPDYRYTYIPVNFDIQSQQLFDQSNNLNHNDILNKINGAPVILDFTKDHNRTRHPANLVDVKNILDQQLGKDVYYLTSDATYQEDRIIFFPGWLYASSLEYSKYDYNLLPTRKYKFSSLNRYPAPHRLYLVYQLLKKELYIDNLISCYGFKNPYNGQELTAFQLGVDHLPLEVCDKISKTRMYKECLPGDNLWDNDHSFQHPAFSDCYLNLITESAYTYTFFSEKTCKPLAAGQLFLSVNGQNSVDTLRRLQFECFDDILDNHAYESHSDMIGRIDSMLELLDQIYDRLPDLFNSKIKEIEYNRAYFLSDSFRSKLISPLARYNLINT